MHPPPTAAYHGRSNVPSGPKPAPLPMQNKQPLMANNVVPTAIQQRPQPQLQPKTILKHPSQYKPTISQPPIQQQQQPPPSQPSSLDVVNQTNNINNIQSSGTTITSHSTSQSLNNSLTGTHVVTEEKLKTITTSESK